MSENREHTSLKIEHAVIDHYYSSKMSIYFTLSFPLKRTPLTCSPVILSDIVMIHHSSLINLSFTIISNCIIIWNIPFRNWKYEKIQDKNNASRKWHDQQKICTLIKSILSTAGMTITIGICILPFKFLNYSIEFYLYIFFLFFCCRIQFL